MLVEMLRFTTHFFIKTVSLVFSCTNQLTMDCNCLYLCFQGNNTLLDHAQAQFGSVERLRAPNSPNVQKSSEQLVKLRNTAAILKKQVVDLRLQHVSIGDI